MTWRAPQRGRPSSNTRNKRVDCSLRNSSAPVTSCRFAAHSLMWSRSHVHADELSSFDTGRCSIGWRLGRHPGCSIAHDAGRTRRIQHTRMHEHDLHEPALATRSHFACPHSVAHPSELNRGRRRFAGGLFAFSPRNKPQPRPCESQSKAPSERCPEGAICRRS